ncbi:MAG: mechanosensitive ion channel, partial [Halobacteriota archaeon]|nr:mechanosensitive ion channel [Halobacteriota archaeon]
EVRDIGLRSTRLYDVIDHAMITMPNSDVSNMKITNISMPDVKLKIRVPIGVAYGTDIELVKKILLEIAEEAPEVLNDPQPDVFFVDFGDSSLNFVLISWIGNVRRKMEVIDHINCKIKNRFEEEGIDIPFPIRTIYMQS